MKKIDNLKDYRLKYKRYFGIEFGKEYVIHHIDFDRSNNDISNLLLLPKELHSKYHMIINAISISPEKPKADGFIDVKLSNTNITHYNVKMFELLPETIAECNKWLEYKRYGYDNSVVNNIFGGRRWQYLE